PMGKDPRGRSYQEHKFDRDQPEIHERLREIRQIFDAYPGDRVAIGETYFDDPRELMAYSGKDQDELHLPFNFSLINLPWEAGKFRREIGNYYAALLPGAAPNFVLGNHDRHRLASRYGQENHRSAALLLLTLKGSPTLYYGDELGMIDGEIPPERYQDPVMTRKPDTDEGRDPERTPMQWDSSPNAGFSPAGVDTWLPVNPDFQKINVQDELKDPDSTLNYYRRLLAMRKSEPALQEGEIDLLGSMPDEVLAFTRIADTQTLLVAINFGYQIHRVELPEQVQGGAAIFSTLPGETKLDRTNLWLRPHEGVLIARR
ncbi:MAG TPA: alpha-amylase family glycosyl hydrolase, partial [Anaerolineales bacterium]|nr:alpha-amylase family glycosyl hydrolase [Anaerolineales bacterium]